MKSYVISVSLGTGCYRHIQISAEATLYKLHKAILDAFGFEDDHAHAFFMDNRLWASEAVYCYPKSEPGDYSSKSHKLEKFRLQKGDKFKYVFDFGASWEFQCKFLREVDGEIKAPKIIRCVGDAPEQYPVYEEDAWDEDGEEDEDNGFPDIYPDEVTQKIYEIIPLSGETIKRIEQYFQAAARLYGILSVGELYELYNSQNTSVSEDDFLAVAEVLRHRHHPEYAILGQEALYLDAPVSTPTEREIVWKYLWIDGPEEYYRLVSMQTGKPLKILPANEFLRYADMQYYPETSQNGQMKKYLRSRAKALKSHPDVLWMVMQDMIAMDFRLQEIVDYMESDGLTFDGKNDIGEFVSLYQDLNNHTRKYANRGHTPDELFSMTDRGKKLALRNAPIGQMSLFDEPQEKPQLTLVGRPSRNASCPCGSGRKYKNCCGKNDK